MSIVNWFIISSIFCLHVVLKALMLLMSNRKIPPFRFIWKLLWNKFFLPSNTIPSQTFNIKEEWNLFIIAIRIWISGITKSRNIFLMCMNECNMEVIWEGGIRMIHLEWDTVFKHTLAVIWRLLCSKWCWSELKIYTLYIYIYHIYST